MKALSEHHASIVKKLSFKELARKKMARQIQDFLQQGGRIKAMPNGASGRDNPQTPLRPQQLVFDKTEPRPESDRSPLLDVLARLDARRNQLKRKTTPRPRPRRAKQKVLYDDFGEPIRKIWLDDY